MTARPSHKARGLRPSGRQHFRLVSSFESTRGLSPSAVRYGYGKEAAYDNSTFVRDPDPRNVRAIAANAIVRWRTI
jgi:hypothetical protein